MLGIVGYEKERREIEALREMLCQAEKYRACGVRIPRGLLLTGRPGVGKTVMARSMAGDGVNLVELRATDLSDRDVPEMIAEKFAEAKTAAPCVLLLDELDKIVGRQSLTTDSERVKKALMQELDALTPEDDVLVVATCNSRYSVGPEMVRPGRFDRRLEIPDPDENTRRQILEIYFARIKAKKCFDMEALARNTRGFTGAKLECLANDTGIMAMEKETPTITDEDVRLVINKLEFGGNEKSFIGDDESLNRLATHEAGHALAALFLYPEALFGASVMSQGDSKGHIRFVPDENRVQSVAEIELEAAVLLGGHVAERVMLGEYMSGSSSDLEGAASRIHYLCAREGAYGYGMVLLGMMRGQVEAASEEIKTKAAEKVEERLTALDARVEQLLLDYAEMFAEIRDALKERRVLSRDELLEIKAAALAEKAG